MIKLYSYLSVFCGIICMPAQEVVWQRNIPSSTQDFLSHLTTTIDQQFLIGGSSIHKRKDAQSASDNDDSLRERFSYDYHLIKLNQQGQKVWEKFYGGLSHDYLHTATATQEGGFLLAGISYSMIGGDKKDNGIGGADIWLLKLSENGEEEWQRTIGTELDEEAKSVVQTTDLGFVMAGNIQNHTLGLGSKDILVAKLDRKGNLVSQTILGGRGLDEVEKMIPTKDGGVLLAMYSRSGDDSHLLSEKLSALKTFNTTILEKQSKLKDKENPLHNTLNISTLSIQNLYTKTSDSYGEGDYWVVKLDKAGKVEWQKNFGGNEDERIKDIALTSKGYIISGESRSSNTGNKNMTLKEGSDLWILALDDLGNEVWQQSYSFGNRDVLMSLNTIWDKSGLSEKGFLLGGYTQSEGKKRESDEQFWMLYLDSKGNEVWRKYVEGASKKQQERLVSARFISDGAYVVAGTSAEALGKEQWKIVKLGDKELNNLIEKQEVRVYPNPVSEYCYVEIGVDFREAEIQIYDMSGKLVQSLKTRNSVTKIPTKALPQGTYIINLVTENKTLNTKIVKL